MSKFSITFWLSVVATIALTALKFTVASSIPLFVLFLPISIWLVCWIVALVAFVLVGAWTVRKIWKGITSLLK